MQGVHLRKYGVAATIVFELYEIDGVDFRVDWTPVAGDVFMMRDEAAEEQVTNAAGNADLTTLVTDEGKTYSITLALEDMQAARIEIILADQGTKAFLDKTIIIETYGNASAQHAFDLDTASVAQGADNNTILSSLTIANGAVDSKITYIMDTILTEGGAGRLAAAFIKLFDVATPVFTAVSVNQSANNNTKIDSILAKMLAYFRLSLRSDAGPTTDDSAELTEINADGGSGAGNYVAGDSLEGIFDTGEANWPTATGFATPTNISAGTITTVSGNVNGSVGSVSGDTKQSADNDVLLQAIAGYIDTEIATLITEMAKIPKSDSNVIWNITAIAQILAAMQADNTDLDYLVTDLVNKKSIKIATGISTQYNDADGSLGDISSGYTDDGVDVVRPRQVKVKP